MPCEGCVFCQQLNKGIHPDVFYLKKEDDKKNISVEQVREMQKFLSLTSFLNSYKIAMIINAQELSEAAQNALLKILEEPSSKTILILLAEDYNFLLPTIVSRCQLVKFRPLNGDKIFHYLLSLGASREQAKILNLLCCGRIGLALELFQKPELFNSYLEKMNQILNFFNQDLSTRFKNSASIFSDAKNAIESTASLNKELDYWQLILRDMLLIKNNLGHMLVNYHFKETFEKISAGYSNSNLLNLLKQVTKIKQYLNYNINPRLVVENLLIDL